jgi:putative tryptophan/tyrosine transport system substrate-binding protein
MRLTTTLALALALLVAPLAAEAQRAGRVHRIGILESSPMWEPFYQRLRDLGYVEGQNLVVERRRVTEGKPEQIFGMAQQLVGTKVEVIATAGAVATGAAKQATTTIPIVISRWEIPSASGSCRAWPGRAGMSPGRRFSVQRRR